MIGVEPSPGASNDEMITWDAYNAAAGISAMQISTEPTPSSSNFELILWDLYQAILTGGGGGGGGLPSGSNGSVLAYFGNWYAADTILDSTGIPSYSIEDRITSDSLGLDSILGDRRKLVNSNSVDSINWEDHQLLDFTGNLLVNYNEGKLYNTLTNVVYDWETNRLFDSAGQLSVDPGRRFLFNDISQEVFTWSDPENRNEARFYPSIKVGFGNILGGITYPITIGAPGISFESTLLVGAPVGSPVGGIVIDVGGTARVLAIY